MLCHSLRKITLSCIPLVNNILYILNYSIVVICSFQAVTGLWIICSISKCCSKFPVMPCMAGLQKHPWQWSEQRTHTWWNPLSRLVFGDSWASTNNPFFSVYRGAALGPTLAISLRKAFVEPIAASHIERINHILILGMSPLHSLTWMLFHGWKTG